MKSTTRARWTTALLPALCLFATHMFISQATIRCLQRMYPPGRAGAWLLYALTIGVFSAVPFWTAVGARKYQVSLHRTLVILVSAVGFGTFIWWAALHQFGDPPLIAAGKAAVSIAFAAWGPLAWMLQPPFSPDRGRS